MNSIIVSGNITRDVEVKTTPSGVAVTSFTVAVKRPYAKDGVDYIVCVAWRQTAETIAKFFSKGSFIMVRGWLNIRTYEKEDGTKASVAEVNVEEFGFGGSSQKKEETTVNQETGVSFAQEDYEGGDELPF